MSAIATPAALTGSPDFVLPKRCQPGTLHIPAVLIEDITVMAFVPIATILIPVLRDIATNPAPTLGGRDDGSGDSKPYEFEPETWGREATS